MWGGGYFFWGRWLKSLTTPLKTLTYIITLLEYYYSLKN
jgi:hypothetical protein